MARFLCDRMLLHLAKWLRAAGYDAAKAAEHESDGALLARARREERTLLTGDRRLAERHDAGDRVVVLQGQGLDALTTEVAARCGVDWLQAPLSRCLACNVPVEPALQEDWSRVPAEARALLPAKGALERRLSRCPRCGRVYWFGGHARRMVDRLQAWAARVGDGAR